jgi:hypothetical protein
MGDDRANGGGNAGPKVHAANGVTESGPPKCRP